MLVVSSKVFEPLTSSQRDLTRSLADIFAAAGAELYLVGGIVRDALLGRARLADLDFATSAQPPRTRFGTIGAIFGEEPDRLNVEVTTYRREAYPEEHRFPEVAFDATLTDDLGRRDFTMNAIAVDAR